jgi:Glycosyl transferases group 1
VRPLVTDFVPHVSPLNRGMRVAIVCNKTPPDVCGIGDHSAHLASALQEKGAEVDVFGAKTASCLEGPPWSRRWFDRLKERIDAEPYDAVILQYTPLMYAGTNGRENTAIIDFWHDVCASHRGSLIVHESYFRPPLRPASWIRGTRQKRILGKLIKATSGSVISASRAVIEFSRACGVSDGRAHVIPIGSNFPVAPANRAEERRRRGFSSDTMVLCLLGGGTALRWRASFVNAVDQAFKLEGFDAAWLLLGGLKTEWFEMALPSVYPGILDADDFSRCLQSADLFLLPHAGGICAKRGSVVTAFQHGLPVVATAGYQTETFWKDQAGILLTADNRRAFVHGVRELVSDPGRRERMGAANRAVYQANHTWSSIAERIAAAL